jgi:hypothetical protein
LALLLDHSIHRASEYRSKSIQRRSAILALPIMVLWSGLMPHLVYVENVFASSSDVTTPPNFNIVAVGDFDCRAETTDTINNIVSRDPELTLALGDFSYEETADCWLKLVNPIDEKMKIVMGNHEVVPASLLNQYMSHFNLTKQYYSFDYQNVHFLVMSDYVPDEPISEQYNFVIGDLKNASRDRNIDWIIVSHHVQEYASTKNYLLKTPNDWIRTYHPLFERYNVDLVLQGHQHNYQRTFPIAYNYYEPLYPVILDNNSKSYYRTPEGPIFATVGTGGAHLHYPIGKAPYTHTLYVGHGVLNIDVINDQAQGVEEDDQQRTTILGAKFYANDGPNIDEFIIEK